MNKKQMLEITKNHMMGGCPEANNTLNSANLEFIKTYEKCHDHTYCLKFEPCTFFKTTEKIYNFSCDCVIDAPEDKHIEIMNKVAEFYKDITFLKVKHLYNYLEKEFDAFILIWS